MGPAGLEGDHMQNLSTIDSILIALIVGFLIIIAVLKISKVI
jgi:hypothetical protein